MSKERDPAKVIAAVLQHVPPEMAALRARLEIIKADADYLPPEFKQPVWWKLMKSLEGACNNPPALDWEKRISDIVEGREAIE
jgi:hypothetical protein